MKSEKLKRCLRQRKQSMIREQGFWAWFQTTAFAELFLVILLSISMIGGAMWIVYVAISLIGGLALGLMLVMILLMTMSLWGPLLGELFSSICSRKRHPFILIEK